MKGSLDLAVVQELSSLLISRLAQEQAIFETIFEILYQSVRFSSYYSPFTKPHGASCVSISHGDQEREFAKSVFVVKSLLDAFGWKR